MLQDTYGERSAYSDEVPHAAEDLQVPCGRVPERHPWPGAILHTGDRPWGDGD